MTTVLTREYLDVRPDGWLDYAAKRIAQLYGYLKLLLPFIHVFSHMAVFRLFVDNMIISL